MLKIWNNNNIVPKCNLINYTLYLLINFCPLLFTILRESPSLYVCQKLIVGRHSLDTDYQKVVVGGDGGDHHSIITNI